MSSSIHQGGPLFHSSLTILQQLFQVGLMVLGPVISRSVQGITNFHLFNFFHHSCHKFVVDGFFHKQPPSRNTVLTLVEKYCSHAHSHGLVKFTVVEYYKWRFAAEFKGHFLQVAHSTALHDLLANQSGAGEAEFTDIRVLRKTLSCYTAWESSHSAAPGPLRV